MANPLINEDELYAQIAREHIETSPVIWILIYHNIGDDITTIGLIAAYYLRVGEPIPVDDAKYILKYTENIRKTLEDLRNPESTIRRGHKLHDVVHEILNHHISNDTNAINMVIGLHLMPDALEPIPLEDIKEILMRIHNMRVVLDKLREASTQEGGF